MFGFKKKSAPKAEDVFVVVFRGPGVPGFEQTASRDQAMEAFRQSVALGYFDPATRRRMYVTGPDYRVQPEDPSDPLLIGPAALRAAFTDEEYAALPQVLLAAALVVAL
jgi:hypothetical protein